MPLHHGASTRSEGVRNHYTAERITMTIEYLVRLAVVLSIMLIVFGFALKSTWRDATSLFRSPKSLLRALLSMNVLLPLFAASMAAVFDLRPAIAIGLVTLAVSPVPPFLPGKQLKLVTHGTYVFGLLGATSLLAIVLAPLTVALLGFVFSRRLIVSPWVIARVVALSVLLPFSMGIIVRRLSVRFAERASPLAGKLGTLLLVVAAVPVLITLGPAMMSLIGDGTVAAIVAFTLVGLAVGHLFGGPDPDDRTALALATATRHPGVALAIAAGTFPDQKLVAPAMLLYVLIGAIASTPYIVWRRRLHKRLAPAA
jgi:bile acid:Na+ symporter, BASS family